MVWSGVKLFSSQFTQSAFIGSIVFLAELVCFIWLWKVVAKNSWRQPSMKLTVFSLTCLFLIFSFAGVQPMTGYKDEVFGKVTAFFNEQNEKAEITKRDQAEQLFFGFQRRILLCPKKVQQCGVGQKIQHQEKKPRQDCSENEPCLIDHSEPH